MLAFCIRLHPLEPQQRPRSMIDGSQWVTVWISVCFAVRTVNIDSERLVTASRVRERAAVSTANQPRRKPDSWLFYRARNGFRYRLCCQRWRGTAPRNSPFRITHGSLSFARREPIRLQPSPLEVRAYTLVAQASLTPSSSGTNRKMPTGRGSIRRTA